jgi:hypothetical protein
VLEFEEEIYASAINAQVVHRIREKGWGAELQLPKTDKPGILRLVVWCPQHKAP